MFPVLCLLALSFDRDYSLIFPLDRTNKSEYGNWSFRGSACNLRTSIRLTAVSLHHEYGTVCQRAPTVFRDWEVDMDVHVHGGATGGRGLTFMFTEHLCPEQVEEFHGFQITFATGDTDEGGVTPVTFSEGNFESARQVGAIRLRNNKIPTRIRITRLEEDLSVEYTPFMKYIPLLRVTLKESPAFGYFTVFGETLDDQVDNHDVSYFKTTPRSDYDRHSVDKGLLIENRKVLESNAKKRREAKIARRDSGMKAMHKVLAAMAKHQNDVTRTGGTPDFRDLFRVLDESGERAVTAVTIDHLKVFVNTHVDDTIGNAGRNMQNAMGEIDGYKGDMAELWSYLRGQLLGLAEETKLSLNRLADESLDVARGIKLDRVTPDTLEAVVGGEAADGPSDLLGKALGLVAAAEMIAYVIFFLIKHRKTHGFKKLD
jgi:mannose-binding lectin 1